MRPRTRGYISIAFLAGLVFVPVVIATGLLTEGSAPNDAPADITVTAMRGTLDGMLTEPPLGAAASSRHR